MSQNKNQWLENVDASNTGATLEKVSRAYLVKSIGASPLVLIDPPSAVTTADEAPIRNLLGNFLQWSQANYAITSDQHLSDSGKIQKQAELLVGRGQKILAAMEMQFAKAEAIALAAEADERAFYSAPPLDKGDAVAALQDQQIISALLALDPAGSADAQQQLVSGNKPRWALAVQRYREILPLPTSWESCIDSSWNASCDQANPDKAAAVANRLEVAQWIRQASSALMSKAPRRADSLADMIRAA